MGTVSPGKLSFSQSGVLMRTPDCEKHSLPGPTVPMQKLFQIFEMTVFYESPFGNLSLSQFVVLMTVTT